MDIKYVLGALVVILLISNAFCIYEMQSPNQNFVIGDKSIKLPENYSANEVDISNGKDTILVYKIGNTDINSVIKDYVNRSSENFSINVNDFDSKFPAKKTSAINHDNSSIIKYWFEVDGTIYQMQISNKKDNEYDDIVKNMINSIS